MLRVFTCFLSRDGRASGANKLESQRVGDIMLKHMGMLKVRPHIRSVGMLGVKGISVESGEIETMKRVWGSRDSEAKYIEVVWTLGMK